jgi:hypothetical protein
VLYGRCCHRFNVVFNKLQEYYNYTDVSQSDRGAVAFHPSKRFTWFDTPWTDKGGRRDAAYAKTAVRKLWRQHLSDLSDDNHH